MSNTDRVRALLEQRANLTSQMRALLDAADTDRRTLSAEEEQTFQRLNDDIDALDQRRKQLEESDRRDAEQAEAERRLGAPIVDDRRGGESTGLVAEIREFLAGHRRSVTIRPDAQLDHRQMRQLAAHQRDITKAPATAGGHTVGTGFYAQLVDHLIEVSGVLRAGPTVLITERGDDLPVPRTTAHSTAALTAEGVAITESDPAFAQLTLRAYKYATLIQASSELIDDTYVDLLGYLSMQAGRAAGNAFGVHAITGTGTSQPQGVATAATVGVTGGTGVAGAFTADNLIDLFFSCIAPYRSSRSCGWLMRDATLASVRKLKDTTNQYLWQPSLVIGEPDQLLGKPVYTDPNVAAVGLNARSVLFGDMSRYFVRQVRDIRFERSDEFAFNADLVTFRCVARMDGGLADTTGAVRAFVGGAT